MVRFVDQSLEPSRTMTGAIALQAPCPAQECRLTLLAQSFLFQEPGAS